MGAKVSTFIYCLGTTNLEGKDAPINAMGVLPVLTPEFIPSMFSFSIVLGMRGIDDTSNHLLDIIFKDCEGNVLVEAREIQITLEQLQAKGSQLPEEYRGLMIGMDLRNVVIKKEGVYSTEVSLDGKKLGVFDIYTKSKQREE